MRSFVPALVKVSIFAIVTMLLTGILAATIANTNFGTAAEYTARFTTASGLHEGDDVRIAGVKVGQVSHIHVASDNTAEVEFDIDAEYDLPALVTATVKYRNLLGQRYLSLGTDVPADETDSMLPAGATIPIERTEPALDLTALFDGFRPLFRALEPDQVNQLSYELIQVFQGEAGTVRSLLRRVGSLTSTLAEKDEVIGNVIDNLNDILGTVNERTPQFTDLIDTTQELVTGLSEQRAPIGEAVSGLAELTEATSGLLEQARPPLQQDIAALGDLAGNLSDSEELLDELLQVTPSNLEKFTRVLSYGGWYNYYLCGLSGTIGIDALNVTVPFLPLPLTQQPERCKVT